MQIGNSNENHYYIIDVQTDVHIDIQTDIHIDMQTDIHIDVQKTVFSHLGAQRCKIGELQLFRCKNFVV